MKRNTVGHRTANNVALRAATLALCALSLIACGDDDVGDAPIIMIDAGADMIAPPPVDMSVPRDMGMARTCGDAPMALPDTAVPRCADSTIDCVTACTTAACQTACFAADPIPATTVGGNSVNCSGCLNAEILACAAAGPCDDQWNALTCCAVDNCGGMLTAACAMGECAGAIGALQTCASSAMACTTTALARCAGAVVNTDGGTPPSDGGSAPDADTDAGTDGGPTTPTP